MFSDSTNQKLRQAARNLYEQHAPLLNQPGIYPVYYRGEKLCTLEVSHNFVIRYTINQRERTEEREHPKDPTIPPLIMSTIQRVLISRLYQGMTLV